MKMFIININVKFPPTDFNYLKLTGGPPDSLPGALSKVTDRDAHTRQALICCGKFQDETQTLTARWGVLLSPQTTKAIF